MFIGAKTSRLRPLQCSEALRAGFSSKSRFKQFASSGKGQASAMEVRAKLAHVQSEMDLLQMYEEKLLERLEEMGKDDVESDAGDD